MKPKSQKYEAGKVSYSGLSPDGEKKLLSFLNGDLDPPTESVFVGDEYKLVEVVPPADLPLKSFGLISIGKMWNMVTVRYNLATGQAGNITTEPLHTNRVIAFSIFEQIAEKEKYT